MRTNFRKLSWGFLFVLLDIRLGFIDILPDFVGYLLILSALRQLDRHYPGYNKAWPAAVVLCLASLVPVGPQFNLLLQPLPPSPLWVGLTGLHQLLLLALVVAIFGTLTRHARSQGKIELANASRNRMRLFVLLQLALLFTLPYSLNTTDTVGFIIPLTILMLLAMILLVFLCRKAAKTFAGEYTGREH
ncbi:hypothetical protein PA598K_02457 [Paenibacillus sp. 598K]|uniref:hypothetical protein n=1 Tax=Paenibacillus sp. 598K TaxID=1117987 RepID=UPI000FF99A4C|nr:hypothetical protein [Paenibacillus sp. 598K]GBF74126.1 hypothetical protein PA598K_02457 [Paenibacillus sp. 598K]